MIRATNGGSRENDNVAGTLAAIDRLGRLVFLSVDLDDETELFVESHAEKIGDRGPVPAIRLHLSWQPDRAEVVASDSS